MVVKKRGFKSSSRRFLCFLYIMSLLLGGSGMAALAMTETSVTNHFRTGVVHIELTELEIKDGKEVPYESGKEIMPGKSLSEIPRITNKGSDCFVRAKVGFSGTDALSDSNLTEIGDGWKKAEDGYWYYGTVLRTGDQVDLCKGLQIPTDFPQEDAKKDIHLQVQAEAIQSKNVTPDFQAEAPWGNVKIQVLSKDKDYELSKVEKTGTEVFRVVYEKEAGTLVTNQNDFFTNLPVMVPGDTYRDVAKLSNRSDKEMKLYFRSDIAKDSDLLAKTQIRITSVIGDETKTVYEGALSDSRMNGNLLLGTIPSKANGNLRFQVSLPEDVDNEYVLSEGAVTWTFSTEPIKDTPVAGEPDPPQTPQVVKAKTVRTGDFSRPGLYLILSGISLAVIAGLLKRRITYGDEQCSQFM